MKVDDRWSGLAGALLVQARLLAGMTQTELAARAGLAQPDVSAYETGRRQPTLPMLYRLLHAAGVEPRIRLEELDDHDASVAAWRATRPTEENRKWQHQQDAFTGAR